MAFLPNNSPRLLLRRLNARPSQHLSKNPRRRKTSASSETTSSQLNPPKPPKPLKPENSKSIPEQAVSNRVPLLQRLGPVTRAVNAYDDVQKRRPLATQLCASLCVYFCGDMLAQYIDGESYDPLRTLRHLTIGAGAAIPGYTWFMWLNKHFNYPSFILSLATKIIVNQLVFAPTFNTYFFSMQSLLSGASVAEAWERIKNTVPQSFINSWKLWPAVTAFSFTFVSPQYRFLFAGGFAVGWQSYLSWLNQRAAEDEKDLAASAKIVAIEG